MPETGLTIQYTDLQKRIGFYLYGQSTYASLSAGEQENVTALINQGLRRFYYPAQVMQGIHHDWTFLRTKLSFKIDDESQDYEMPFNFGGAEGDLLHDPNDNVMFPVKKVTAEMINAFRSRSITTVGPPMNYAERPVSKGGESSGRWEIMIWPTPDDEYTMIGTQRILPLAPNSTSQLYMYGGPEHSETILVSCMAAAELFLEGRPGVMAQQFQQCLLTSITLDNMLHAPETLGYNSDYRRGRQTGMRDSHHYENYSNVTYGNVDYGA